MPQPALQLESYLATPLPALREQFPPGTGGTGPRDEWSEGSLMEVRVISDFGEQVVKYFQTLPQDPITPHPTYKYPTFAHAVTQVPNPLKTPQDLQKALSTLPLAAVSSTLTALDSDPADLLSTPARDLDRAGYESDGGDEAPNAVFPAPSAGMKTKAWVWRYSKSPLGTGEFHLVRQGDERVWLVVRTVNKSAFTDADWDEFEVTGKYHYNRRSKASWYWSRASAATRRLGCAHFVLTDYQRWAFGFFSADRTTGHVCPRMGRGAAGPSVMQGLFWWAGVAVGRAEYSVAGAAGAGGESQKNDEGEGELFPDNPARRVSVSEGKSGGRAPVAREGVKKGNESDIEESDAEDNA